MIGKLLFARATESFTSPTYFQLDYIVNAMNMYLAAFRASTISTRLNHPHLTGLVSLVTGMAAFLAGRWKQSREALERAEEILQRKCVGVAWELATARLMHCVSLFFLGEFRELGNRLPGLLENAELRGDVYESTDLRIRISHAHLLTLGRTREAADEVKRAIANWPQDRFYLQHWWNLIASVEIWLYGNEPDRAWQTIERSWPRLRRSLFLIGAASADPQRCKSL